MSLSQLEQENKFKKHLGEYWSSKGITQIKIPQIGGQELNLFKLYKAVCKKGGGQAVSHNKLWKQIVDQFGLPSTCTSASFTLKNHYQKYLLGYQQRFFFGKDDSADLPELVAGRQRKPLKEGEIMPMYGSRFGASRMDGQVTQSNLSTQLKKFYQKGDPNQHVYFLKRTKMYPVMSEVKHIILAFQSQSKNQIIYGINILLLFSMNTQAPFLFSQYPNVLESISQYLSKVYPPKSIFQYQCIRTLMTAIRNLMMNHKNLQPLLESPLIQIFVTIFQQKLDKQITRNVADIFSSLTRIGWDCRQLFQMIESYLFRDSFQDLQTGIDLLRSLVEQKQQICENIICSKIQYFARLLIHSSLQIRQAILQIFAYLSDKSQKTRVACLTNLKLMERLFALMAYSNGPFQKQAQMACYIINNISQIHNKDNQSQDLLKYFKRFQKNLALVSFSDEYLSPVTSSILFSLSGRVSAKQRQNDEKQNKVLANMRLNINRDQLSESLQEEDQLEEDDLQEDELQQEPFEENEQQEE